MSENDIHLLEPPVQTSGWSAKRISLPSAVLEGVQVWGKQGHKQFMQALKLLDRHGKQAASRTGKTSDAQGDIMWGDRTTPLSQVIQTYLGDLAMRRLKPSSIRASKLALRQLLVASGDIPISYLRPDHLRRAREVLECWPGTLSKRKEYRELSDEELFELGKKLKVEVPASESILTMRSYLASFLECMVEQKLIDESPISGFPAVQPDLTEKAEKRPFTDEEITQLFDPTAYAAWSAGLPHRWWGPLIGLYTGARVAEVAQLKVADILLQNDIWCMAFRVTADPDRVAKRYGKSRASIKNSSSPRIIPIPPQVLDAGFLDYLDDVRAAAQHRLFPHLTSGISKATLEDNGGSYGDALTRQFVYYLRKRIKAEKRMGFHTFRHTSPSAWEDAGFDLKLIASITGHEAEEIKAGSKSTLKKRYLHGKSQILRVRQQEALASFRPAISLPRYTPGQFAPSFGPGNKLYP